MNAVDLRRFLTALGAEPKDIDESSSGVWMNTHCPLAFYTHGSGEDVRPSFGASISNEGHSVYFCFGCSPEPTPLPRLLHNVWLMSGDYPEEAASIFSRCENLMLDRVVPVVVPDLWEREIFIPTPLPLNVLARYPKLLWSNTREAEECKRYLEGRGVTRLMQNYFGVRYSFEDHALAFSLTNKLGDTFLVRMRSRHKKEMWTAKFPGLETSKLKEVGAWFGMHLLDHQDHRAVILVEGEIDALRLASLGCTRVLASATSAVTDAQINALSWDNYILGYDADVAGRRAHEKIIKRLSPVATLFVADWSLALRRDGKPCKDPGDLPGCVELEQVFSRLKVVS